MATTEEELDALVMEVGLQLKLLKQATADARKMMPAPIPFVNWWATPYGVLIGATGNTIASGRQQFHPFLVPDPGYTIDKLGVRISAAATSGATSWLFGLYEDLDGMPNTLKGPVATADVPLTATGNIQVDLSAPVALKPGQYWVSFLCPVNITQSNASVVMSTNMTYAMPVPASVSFSTAIRGYVLTGRSTLLSGTDFRTLGSSMGVIGGTEAILAVFRRSA